MSFFTSPADMGLLHLGCKLSGRALCRAGNTGPESVVCGALRRNPVEFARDFFYWVGLSLRKQNTQHKTDRFELKSNLIDCFELF